MNFSYETRAGVQGNVTADTAAEARQKLTEQYGVDAIESIEGENVDTRQPVTGGWGAFWDQVRALPPR